MKDGIYSEHGCLAARWGWYGDGVGMGRGRNAKKKPLFSWVSPTTPACHGALEHLASVSEVLWEASPSGVVLNYS